MDKRHIFGGKHLDFTHYLQRITTFWGLITSLLDKQSRSGRSIFMLETNTSSQKQSLSNLGYFDNLLLLCLPKGVLGEASL